MMLYCLNIAVFLLVVLMLVKIQAKAKRAKRLGKVVFRIGLEYELLTFAALLFYIVYTVLRASYFKPGILILRPGMIPWVLGYGLMGALFIYFGLQAKTIREGGIASAYKVFEWNEIISYRYKRLLGGEVIIFEVPGSLFKGFSDGYRVDIKTKDREAVHALLEQYLPGKYKDKNIHNMVM